MYKLIISILISAILIGHVKAASISLKCSVTVDNYTGIEDQAQFFDAKLIGFKHKETGAQKLKTISNYEFWVMNHSLQTIDNITRVVNFQVAIRNVVNNTFTHALSNSYTSNLFHHSARISLVEYHKSQLLEKGEIMFSCKKDVFD